MDEITKKLNKCNCQKNESEKEKKVSVTEKTSSKCPDNEQSFVPPAEIHSAECPLNFIYELGGGLKV
jgi:hypothetical protein